MQKQRVMFLLIISLLLVGTGFTTALGQSAGNSALQAWPSLTLATGNELLYPDDAIPVEMSESVTADEPVGDEPATETESQVTDNDDPPVASNGLLAANADSQVVVVSETRTLMDLLETNEQLTEFRMLVEAAGLADNLDRDGPFTVFAPTNAAMAILDTPLMAEKTASTGTEILLYHVINGRYFGPEIAELEMLPTLMGGYVAIAVTDGQIVLNDEVVVTTIDIQARNGVLHIVDTVLLPPVNSLLIADKGSWEHSLDEVLAADGRFTTFLSLVEMAGLTEELANLNHAYTVFAPTDAAFEQLSEEEFDRLFTDQQHRETILRYHLVADRLGINQIAHARFIPTIEGRPLRIATDENMRVFINGRPIEAFNIVAANGVIHAVEMVLLP